MATTTTTTWNWTTHDVKDASFYSPSAGGTTYRFWFRDLGLGVIDVPPANALIATVARAHLERRLKRASNIRRTTKAA